MLNPWKPYESKWVCLTDNERNIGATVWDYTNMIECLAQTLHFATKDVLALKEVHVAELFKWAKK